MESTRCYHCNTVMKWKQGVLECRHPTCSRPIHDDSTDEDDGLLPWRSPFQLAKIKWEAEKQGYITERAQLEATNANLRHRLGQLETYVSHIAPQSKLLSFEEIVKGNKHPIDMTDAEMETYTNDLTRAYAVGDLKKE